MYGRRAFKDISRFALQEAEWGLWIAADGEANNINHISKM